MSERVISDSDRQPFFACFSKLHDGALISLRGGDRVEVLDQPFHGITCDNDDVIIHTGCDRDFRLPHVASVRVLQIGDGDADAAVSMMTDDGKRAEVRFRWPVRADVLDPAVE